MLMKVNCIISGTKVLNNCKLSYSTSFPLYNKWRILQGLEPNPNSYGPLKNLPDYSFVDGRPTLISETKIKDLERQRNYCKKITELSQQLDFALELHSRNMEDARLQRQAKLDSKLKPKGAALLKKKSS